MTRKRGPRLFHMIALAQHRLRKSMDSAFGETLSISSTQLGALFILEEYPGASPSNLSEGLGINASAITALIGRMEASGLVRRQPSDEDGRAVHLFATPEGLAKAIAARPILARLNARITRGFSEQEIIAFARFLETILERF